RLKILERRNEMSADEIKNLSRSLLDNLKALNEYMNARTVMFFVGKKQEVQTLDFISRELGNNKRIIVPITLKNERTLLASEILSTSELHPSLFNVLEPKQEFIRPFSIENLDLILVPGLAFDRTGHRLGYGFGYYDNFLKGKKQKTLTIGLAFHFQLVDHVPRNGLDVPVDKIVTEKEIITCRSE
ncbi:MAG: 5-formyltetrahydrofolate cyclo-ligase, partial [Candidatus Helarchaeales archaeon]